GWAQALPAVRKAYEKLELDWSTDASGEAIDKAILAEDEEVFAAANAASGAHMDNVTIEDIGMVAKFLQRFKGEKGDEEPEIETTEKADSDEPTIADVLDAVKGIGERVEALEAEYEEEDEEEPEEEDEPEDEEETDEDETEDAEKADGEEEAEEKPNPVLEAIGALTEKVDAISQSTAALEGRVEVTEKAGGISRALPESTGGSAESEDDDPGMEAVGLAYPNFVKGALGRTGQ
ncbi:unnamed protein product, partial [marine sediment metagenome]